MATEQAVDEIKSRVLNLLKGTPFEVTYLVELKGGTANFIYRGGLVTPLGDATKEIVIKHGEGFMASSPSFNLTTDRCNVEEQCLRAEAQHETVSSAGSPNMPKFTVRTPKVYMYDDESKTMVQEYLPYGLNLKAFSTSRFEQLHTSDWPCQIEKDHCLQLGRALAEYITEFHQRTQAETKAWRESNGSMPEPHLHRAVKGAKDMQSLKHMINHDWLIQRIDKYPDYLEPVRPTFEKVKQMALDELKGDLSPIHGDFWTGNILITDVPIEDAKRSPILVTDWEMAQLGVPAMDHGQMLAEMYLLYHYKNMKAGTIMMQGYRGGLGKNVTQDELLRIIIHLGTHLISFGTITPGWGTAEQATELARVGRDFIVSAWEKDVGRLMHSGLNVLFLDSAECL